MDESVTKKCIVIPGWLDIVSRYGLGDGVDIWLNEEAGRKFEQAEYIVAHSLGCTYTLKNRELNPQAKFILVNPLLRRRSIIVWIIRWIRFAIFEGTSFSAKRFLTLLHLVSNIKKTLTYLRIDLTEMLETVQGERIIIIRGAQDDFFCDQRSVEIIQGKNFNFLEVKGAGHSWKPDFNKIISEIIQK